MRLQIPEICGNFIDFSHDRFYDVDVLAQWNSPLMGVGLFVIGCCIGSFLNVAIYRIPRGLSVNEPKRSFCPHCKETLPAWQNIPIITWLLQRGKCRHCQAPITVRYLIVELLTGLLYLACWRMFPQVSALLAFLLVTVLVTISFIDAEHQVIPIHWTTVTSVLAILGALSQPHLLDLLNQGGMHSALDGLKRAVLGWFTGFASLWLVIQIGKFFLGRKKMEFDEPVQWKLQEGFGENEQLHIMIDDEAISWDDLFFRDTDRLILKGHGIKLNGKSTKATDLVIERTCVTYGENRFEIAALKSLEGKATSVVIPREAMGSGDPHFLGMIGAFLGWQAVFFTIFLSSLYAIVAAILGRVGFGRPLPYGPFLALGALTWMFGGWKTWLAYFQALGLSSLS